jgi:hypothetical protein
MSGGVAVAETLTHVQSPAKPVSTSYQKERLNIFLNPALKHQIDVLSAEWAVPLVEVVRRILSRGLQGIMLPVPPTCNGERREANER